MINTLLRGKVLEQFRFDGAFRVAVDGVCFASFNKPHCEHCLRRTHDGKTTYFHYALVAMLVSPNGMVLPLAVEFIENTLENGKPLSCDDEFKKQDCELKAFYRLTSKIKQHHPRLPICLLLDGLYCNQNVIAICEKNQWDYFITLKDDSVPALQEKIRADLKKHPENQLQRNENDVSRQYLWTDIIVHRFGNNIKEKKRCIFTVFCLESHNGQSAKSAKFAYLTNIRPKRDNIEELVNQGGRQRWKIENQGFNTLKNHGMELEHGFGVTGNNLYNYLILRLIAFVIEQLMIHTDMFRKLQAVATASEIIRKPTIKFFRSLKSMANQLLASLKSEFITLPDISNWRVSLNTS